MPSKRDRQHHHHVYVVELSDLVWNEARFRGANPDFQLGKPFVYVGTAHASSVPLLRLLVVGSRCFSVNGAQSGPAWHAAARRLACAVNCRVLGLYLAGDESTGWRFAQADAQCELRLGGDAAVHALAAAMDMPVAPTEPGRAALPRPGPGQQPTAACL